MLFTICAIVRQKLEQEKNPERRETILDMLELLDPKETPNLVPQKSNS